MARFKIKYTLKRTKETIETEPTRYVPTPDADLVKKSKVVTIVRDSEGEDHPDNAGKFFLYQIVK